MSSLSITRLSVNTRRPVSPKPRFQRLAIFFCRIPDTRYSPVGGEPQQTVGKRLRHRSEIPEGVLVEDQHRCGKDLPHLALTVAIIGAQPPKTGRVEPVNCILPPPERFFIVVPVERLSNAPRINQQTSLMGTRHKARNPVAYRYSSADLRLARSQRHESGRNARSHTAIVFKDGTEPPCHDTIRSITVLTHSRACRPPAAMSQTNSWPRATTLSVPSSCHLAASL